MKLKPLVMQVRPHLIYKPETISGSSPPDPSSNYHLLDRVVNVRQGYSVPMGWRGTVIGIKNALKVMDIVYEVLFDKEFSFQQQFERVLEKAKVRMALVRRVSGCTWGLETRLLKATGDALLISLLRYALPVTGSSVSDRMLNKIDTNVIKIHCEVL